MIRPFCILIIFVLAITTQAQTDSEKLPYFQILETPADYSSGNVLARMVDGLGYRYHWASEGLREEDLAYRPSADASNTLETLRHIYGLAETTMNTALNKPNIRPADFSSMSYASLRQGTLENLKRASEAFRGMSAEEIESLQLSFQRGEKLSSFPVWNLINGPLADAIYHTGQIVSFRRTSGNPIDGTVNVFRGKNREQ